MTDEWRQGCRSGADTNNLICRRTNVVHIALDRDQRSVAVPERAPAGADRRVWQYANVIGRCGTQPDQWIQSEKQIQGKGKEDR